jgi:hypothetical protein
VLRPLYIKDLFTAFESTSIAHLQENAWMICATLCCTLVASK